MREYNIARMGVYGWVVSTWLGEWGVGLGGVGKGWESGGVELDGGVQGWENGGVG